MRQRVVATLLGCALLLTACSDDGEPVAQPPLIASEPPTYDASLEPAAAVMALVPEEASVLVVTDYDELRLLLAQVELSDDSRAQDRRRFWRLVDRKAVLLAPGRLRAVDRQLRRTYGFGQDDVAWEARFRTPSGEGWVLQLHADVDLDSVQEAIDAGEEPLAGAELDRVSSLVLRSTTADPLSSWAADPDRVALVGAAAASTYVDTTCLPYDVVFDDGDEADLAAAPAADVAALDDLGAFAVSYGLELATAHLGLMRTDVFDRARLPEILPRTDPDFALGYRDPVGDPTSGRIGYRLGDPVIAARLARERHLPFAVCAS